MRANSRIPFSGLKDAPIRRKVTAVSMSTALIALLLTAVTFVIIDFLNTRDSLDVRMSSLAAVVSTNSQGALAFDDADRAAKNLEGLRSIEEVDFAALVKIEVDSTVSVLADYAKANAGYIQFVPRVPEVNSSVFSLQDLQIYRLVEIQDEVVGALFLKVNLSVVYGRIWTFGGIMLAVLVFVLLLTFLVSGRFHRVITTPLDSLVTTARAVTSNHDYSVRAQKFGDDEVGLVIDAFNEMLVDLQDLHHDLENRVHKRTSQLQQAVTELEAFSYSVSHDLRAPLRAVDGFSSALLEDYDDEMSEEQRRYLVIIKQSAKQMGALIDGLLAFSRLGRREVSMAEFSVSSIALQAANELELSGSFDVSSLRISEVPKAYGDSTMVRQVLVNLLSNAYKFTADAGTRSIVVGGETYDKDFNRYYVRDNGVGFDMKYADKLFGVFQRLHHNNEFEGSGVGLAIVERVITRHGGRVWAESEPGKGATFYFTLPKHRLLVHDEIDLRKQERTEALVEGA